MKTNSHIDLSIFEKIEDIIFLDEPILSHLKLNGKDYLLYLVENLDDSDIFILFDIEEEDIFKYLTKGISLRELIIRKNILLLLERDFEGEVLDSQSIMAASVSEDYLPDTDSFLEYEPLENSYYYEKINEYTRKLYLYDLRKNAFYLKFSTNDRKYGDTIGLRELTNTLLKNLSTSYKNFVAIDFEKKFINLIPEEGKRNSVLKSVFEDTDLRMVDLKYGSFEIGLSTDKLMKSHIEFKEVKEWANEVGDNYKRIVLDDNIDNTEIKSLLDTYSDEERNKIFDPVLKIIKNHKYDLKVKSAREQKYSSLGINKDYVREQLVTKNFSMEVIYDVPKHLELITVTTIIDKNSKRKTINLEDTLFSSVNSSEYELTYNDFKKYGYDSLSIDIHIPISIENYDSYILLKAIYNEQTFSVTVDNDKIEEGIRKLIDKIYEYVINL
ncbi:hypothetical protein [Chryseobacterium indoltheticum]|uniref:Uncharacterized protein n=1 Tax=Chryseobacterium indoltheticum TaxID=254 RepID=A0A381FKU7_9FLAO|nr:hypothetical protein [Chryseobacterium indoltheticum]SUX47186.1 Uncharacterised protein [Chryseobacterium indoltheticum]